MVTYNPIFDLLFMLWITSAVTLSKIECSYLKFGLTVLKLFVSALIYADVSRLKCHPKIKLFFCKTIFWRSTVARAPNLNLL